MTVKKIYLPSRNKFKWLYRGWVSKEVTVLMVWDKFNAEFPQASQDNRIKQKLKKKWGLKI